MKQIQNSKVNFVPLIYLFFKKKSKESTLQQKTLVLETNLNFICAPRIYFYVSMVFKGFASASLAF